MKRLALLFCLLACGSLQADPLPSWEGDNKKRIIDFVERIATPGAQYVPPADRIAVFDNDGTLWAEQPIYFQLAFALDRVQVLADDHPEWRQKEPFASALKGDQKGIVAGGAKSILELVMATHADMSTGDFAAIVQDWIESARHPSTNQLYRDMVYQPMLELLTYLRAKQFKTYIVSGGGIEFMRVFSQAVYGIPPEQVIGSSIKTRYQVIEDTPVIFREAAVNFVDDKAGKPVAIQQHIGRRPLMAFGNSDGDYEMIEWTTAGDGPRLGAFVHHTDGKREWAYDRNSHIGRLERGLDAADENDWLLIDMKTEWREVFPRD